MRHYSLVLLAALAGHAAATPCPPKWLVEGRASWISASTRLDKVLAAMPTLYPGGLTAPPNATATATGAGKNTTETSSATVKINEASSTSKTASTTTLASTSAAARNSTSDSSASSTDSVSVTRTTTTVTITPSASDSASTTTTSTGEDTEEDSGLDRRDENTEDSEEHADEDETLETRSQQADIKLKEAYELQERFNAVLLKWGKTQEEQEIRRKELQKAEVEVARRIKAAVDFARKVQADNEAREDDEGKEKTENKGDEEGEELKKASKRDKTKGCGCGNRNEKRDKARGCGCGNKNDKRMYRGYRGYPQDLEHERQEDELYAGIGKQLESGLENKEDGQTDAGDIKPLYLITKQFRIYKCQRPNGCNRYKIERVIRGGFNDIYRYNWDNARRHRASLAAAKDEYKEDFREDVKEDTEEAKTGERSLPFYAIERSEKEVGEDKEDKEDEAKKTDNKSPLLADGDEKKQYERISALYMQYRGMLVEAIRRDLDPILKNSKYEEDKEIASQYKEGNEEEQRKRLTGLYMDYRYMLVPKWQEQLDPILYADSE